jgi:hypothetical protein
MYDKDKSIEGEEIQEAADRAKYGQKGTLQHFKSDHADYLSFKKYPKVMALFG